MSEESNQPPPDPAIRFRMRSILAVTTILAIAAAIAAPYYRQLDSAGRQYLATLWLMIGLAGAFHWLLLHLLSRRTPSKAGNYRFSSFATWSYRLTRGRLSHWYWPLAVTMGLYLLGLAVVAVQLSIFSADSTVTSALSLVYPATWGIGLGAACSTAIQALVPLRVRVHDNGIVVYGILRRWAWFSGFDLISQPRSIARLHGRLLHGDLCLDFVPEQQPSLAELLDEKISRQIPKSSNRNRDV